MLLGEGTALYLPQGMWGNQIVGWDSGPCQSKMHRNCHRRVNRCTFQWVRGDQPPSFQRSPCFPREPPNPAQEARFLPPISSPNRWEPVFSAGVGEFGPIGASATAYFSAFRGIAWFVAGSKKNAGSGLGSRWRFPYLFAAGMKRARTFLNSPPRRTSAPVARLSPYAALYRERRRFCWRSPARPWLPPATCRALPEPCARARCVSTAPTATTCWA